MPSRTKGRRVRVALVIRCSVRQYAYQDIQVSPKLVRGELAGLRFRDNVVSSEPGKRAVLRWSRLCIPLPSFILRRGNQEMQLFRCTPHRPAVRSGAQRQRVKDCQSNVERQTERNIDPRKCKANQVRKRTNGVAARD